MQHQYGVSQQMQRMEYALQAAYTIPRPVVESLHKH